MLSLGWQEMVAIFIVALVLFGPRKLPELGRTIGRAISEFRRASNELKATFDREMQQIERENESLKQTASTYMNDVYGSYDSSYYDPDSHRSYDSTTASTNPEQISAPATEVADSTSSAGQQHHTDSTDSVAVGAAAAPAAADGIVARSSASDSASGVHSSDVHQELGPPTAPAEHHQA